jgi:hypothetical protein
LNENTIVLGNGTDEGFERGGIPIHPVALGITCVDRKSLAQNF